MRWSIHTSKLVSGEKDTRAALEAAWTEWQKSAVIYLKDQTDEAKKEAAAQVESAIESAILLVSALPPVMISLQGQVGHAPNNDQDPVRGRISIGVDWYE